MSFSLSYQVERGVGRGTEVMQPEPLTSWGIFFEKYNLIRNILLLACSTLHRSTLCVAIYLILLKWVTMENQKRTKPSVSLRVQCSAGWSVVFFSYLWGQQPHAMENETWQCLSADTLKTLFPHCRIWLSQIAHAQVLEVPSFSQHKMIEAKSLAFKDKLVKPSSHWISLCSYQKAWKSSTIRYFS